MLRDVLSWSFPIAPLFGIMVRVHYAMPILLLGMIGRQAMSKDAPVNSWQDAAWLMSFLFVSVLLHELGHCFAARFMDGEADEVLLWPLGGLAFCRSLPHTWPAHFVFALGGPLVNLFLCLIAALVMSLAFDYVPPFNPLWYPYRYGNAGIDVYLSTWDGMRITADNMIVISLARFFWINWILLLFNLLPGLPFDGGRMLQAVLWPRLGHFQSSKLAIYAGFVIMALVGLWSIIDREPWMAYLTVFIFMSCAQELMALEAAHEDSLFGYDFSQGYTSLEKDEEAPAPKPKKQNFIQRWLAQRAAKREQQEREQREADDRRMDELLDKIQSHGLQSLSDEERSFMKQVADRKKNNP